MARPSRNTDQRLVQAARAMLPETGFSGLSLRKVAEKAGVNLGMFNYHFKNKRAFVQRVMQETYEEFFQKFSLSVSEHEQPEQQLRHLVLAGARFIRENRQMILSLARDAMDGDQDIIRFLEKNFHRHLTILLSAFRKCKKAGVFGDWPLPVAIGMLAGSVLAPSMIAAVVERVRFQPTYELLKKILVSKVLAEKAVVARLDLALYALTAGRVPLPSTGDAEDIEEEWRRALENRGRQKTSIKKPARSSAEKARLL